MFKATLVFILSIVGSTPAVLSDKAEYQTREECQTVLKEKLPYTLEDLKKYVPKGMKFRVLANCFSPEELPNALNEAAKLAKEFQDNPDMPAKQPGDRDI